MLIRNNAFNDFFNDMFDDPFFNRGYAPQNQLMKTDTMPLPQWIDMATKAKPCKV